MLLFAAGVASTAIPGIPAPGIEPDMVMTLLLPPLLYASTVRVSWHLLHFTFLSSVVLGALAVAAGVSVVALLTTSLLLPGIGWSAAILIGLGATFFDTRLFHEAKGRPRVPRAISDTLKGREIVGRVLILATLGLVEESLTSRAHANLFELAARAYLLAIPAGILIGFLVGRAAVLLRRRIDPAPVEIAVSVATPFVAAVLADAAGVSVAASVIAAALTVSAARVDSESGETLSSSEARIDASAFWEQASLLISSLLFLLVGRAVPGVLAGLGDQSMWRVGFAAAAILLAALAVQFLFACAATRLSPIREALVRNGGARPLRAAAVMTWSSTRSAIALVLALSVPATSGERELILAVISQVVILSVSLQGLTLSRVVDWAGLATRSDEEFEEARAQSALRAAAQGAKAGSSSSFDAARREAVRLREADEIGDEVMQKMIRSTDLQERSSDSDVLPGAGPPQP